MGRPGREMSVRAFFEQTLPSVLHSMPADGAPRSLCFVIEGLGAWTIQIGGGAPSVRSGDDPSADLLMIATPASFAALLAGEVPRSILIEGDRSLLDRLIHLLSPPKANVVEL